MDTILCIPTNDNSKRFVLGKPGRRNLLCIGLNPNTANEVKLDATSKNFERIARDNGYDGWLLVNLYPTRNSKGKNLNYMADDTLFEQNLQHIEQLVNNTNFSIQNVLLGWGNDIQEKTYFKKSILAIFTSLASFELNYYAYRVNASGHPSHPSPLVINRFYTAKHPILLSSFDFENYACSLQV